MRDSGYTYILEASDHFIPRTPRAALRAVQQGLLPPEAFINRATSVKPLYEEPFNKDDIDWILAQDIDLETILLVMQILQKLIVSRDGETALFAAESINQIEKRFTDRVNELRVQIKKKATVLVVRELGETYHKLALVNSASKGIRNFYLREAYGFYRKLTQSRGRTKDDYKHTVHISMALGLHAQAEKILEEAQEFYGNTPELILLEAEN